MYLVPQCDRYACFERRRGEQILNLVIGVVRVVTVVVVSSILQLEIKVVVGVALTII